MNAITPKMANVHEHILEAFRSGRAKKISDPERSASARDIESTRARRGHFGIYTEAWKPAAMITFGNRAKDPVFPKSRCSIEKIVT